MAIRIERPRFLSEADCRDVANRLAHFAAGGGYTSVSIVSTWIGGTRWARNQVTNSCEIRDTMIDLQRNVNGAVGKSRFNDTSDAALVAGARRAERISGLTQEDVNSDLIGRLPLEPSTAPSLFSETTYQLDAKQRAATALALTKQARDAGMLSAGYIEVAAVSLGLLDSLGRVRYFPYTQARYSVTVRDPKGVGSGWAGVDWYDWQKIDANALTARALGKCLQSRNPVAIEPGRYTTILEPQAVSDFIGFLVRDGELGNPLDRSANETGPKHSNDPGPFFKSTDQNDFSIFEGGFVHEHDTSFLGEKVVDERITISADPMDPALGFPPYNTVEMGIRDALTIPVYHPTTWIDHGVLTNLPYNRFWGIATLGRSTGLPSSGAFHMHGGDTSIEEMISTTQRGLLVTRFDQVRMISYRVQLYRGYTRDGLWLIENGKISKPVKNMVFTETIPFALNNLEQIGPAQRVFHPNTDFAFGIPQPATAPPLKIRDFSFTALVDAV